MPGKFIHWRSSYIEIAEVFQIVEPIVKHTLNAASGEIKKHETGKDRERGDVQLGQGDVRQVEELKERETHVLIVCRSKQGRQRVSCERQHLQFAHADELVSFYRLQPVSAQIQLSKIRKVHRGQILQPAVSQIQEN